jgi:hypothetical protein
MMRLWFSSYVRRSSVLPEATLSGAAHVVVIALWVFATLPAIQVAEDSISNRLYYIPPPDKLPGGPAAAVHEVVHFVSVTGKGQGEEVGQGTRAQGNAAPSVADKNTGRMERDTVLDPAPVTAPPPPPGREDSIFTVIDVDTAVVRSANSAAPAYPLKLLEAHVTGAVSAQYVVDTTGFADTASFRILKASNPGFIDAVRDALPYMRFRPAKIGAMKVRQLVEQTFTFKIADTVVAVAPKAKKP